MLSQENIQINRILLECVGNCLFEFEVYQHSPHYF